MGRRVPGTHKGVLQLDVFITDSLTGSLILVYQKADEMALHNNFECLDVFAKNCVFLIRGAVRPGLGHPRIFFGRIHTSLQLF